MSRAVPPPVHPAAVEAPPPRLRHALDDAGWALCAQAADGAFVEPDRLFWPERPRRRRCPRCRQLMSSYGAELR